MPLVLAVVFIVMLAAIPELRAADSDRGTAPQTMADVMAAATDDDWRTLADNEVLYLEFNVATVVIALAQPFAPLHVENLRKLVSAAYFDDGAIVRSQDNYVVQWSNPQAENDGRLPDGVARRLEPEFFRAADGLDFVPLQSRDAYAAEVGFVGGFAAARDDTRAWLTHCYGAVGAGRANDADSGNAAELYVVTGHAPRHLDRNVTLLGRVIDGMEQLSSLPRGGGSLGFYEDESRYVPITTLRGATPDDPRWQLLRTDTDTFQALVAARRHRSEAWFVDPADRIGLCNVPLPARRAP